MTDAQHLLYVAAAIGISVTSSWAVVKMKTEHPHPDASRREDLIRIEHRIENLQNAISSDLRELRSVNQIYLNKILLELGKK